MPHDGRGHVHSVGALTYRPEIDGLRALAVAPVVLFHTGATLFGGGFVGVDVFFVISGFLITGILHREIEGGQFSIFKFYERRVRRLFPALFTLIAGTTVLGWFILLPDEFAGLGRQILATCLFVSNVLFWREDGYFDAQSATKPLLHTWSLAVEEQYYIFFPLLLWLGARLLPRAIRPILLIGLVASLILSEVVLRRSPSTAFYMFPTRAWELLLGGLVALVPAYAGPLAGPLSWMGVAAILGAVFTYQEAMPFPGLSALLPCAGAAAILYAARRTSCAAVLSNVAVRFVGLISYSLYLWHWPVIVFLGLKLGRPPTPVITTVAIVLSVGAATLSWWFVERPLRKGGSQGRVWMFAAACMAGGLAVGAVLVGSGGVPARFTPAQNRMVEQAVLEGDALEAAYACQADHRFGQGKEVGACDIGPAGPPRVLIVGDSEAMALKPAFAAVLERLGIPGQLISTPGCTPLLGLDRVDEQRGCAARSAAIADYVRSARPEAIILVASWRGALTTKNTIFKGRQSRDPASRLDNLALALSDTVVAYRAIHLRIGVIRPLPGAPVPIARALARDSREPLSYSIEDYRSMFGGLNAAIDSVQPDALADPAKLICTSNCASTDASGQPLYWDEAHPGDAGNRVFQPMIDSLVADLLKP